MIDKQIPNERRQYEYKPVFTYADNTTDDNDKIMENLYKQIINDGIDVSGCCQYMHHFKPCKDVDVKYCYYKQLKRKEQECNKLYIQLKADEEYHKEEENTLRKIIKNKEERNIELYKENNKLKQTLIEIKEICNNNDGLQGDFNLVDCDKYKLGKNNLANKILQKISEVENDNK